MFGSGGQSGSFGGSGFSSQSGLFGTGITNNQSGVFGQSSVSGFTGSVFGNNAKLTNQTTGMTGITSTTSATNPPGGLFGTSSGQSAASSGLFGVKPELKPGLFASSSPTTSSGLFSSGAQVQKDSGIISSSQASNNTIMMVSAIFVLACTCRIAFFIIIEVKVADILSQTLEDTSQERYPHFELEIGHEVRKPSKKLNKLFVLRRFFGEESTRHGTLISGGIYT